MKQEVPRLWKMLDPVWLENGMLLQQYQICFWWHIFQDMQVCKYLFDPVGEFFYQFQFNFTSQCVLLVTFFKQFGLRSGLTKCGA